MASEEIKEKVERLLVRNTAISGVPGSASLALELETARHKKLVALWGIDVLRKTSICPVDDDAVENCKMANALANLLAEVVGEASHAIQRLEDRKLHSESYSAALYGAAARK